MVFSSGTTRFEQNALNLFLVKPQVNTPIALVSIEPLCGSDVKDIQGSFVQMAKESMDAMLIAVDCWEALAHHVPATPIIHGVQHHTLRADGASELSHFTFQHLVSIYTLLAMNSSQIVIKYCLRHLLPQLTCRPPQPSITAKRQRLSQHREVSKERRRPVSPSAWEFDVSCALASRDLRQLLSAQRPAVPSALEVDECREALRQSAKLFRARHDQKSRELNNERCKEKTEPKLTTHYNQSPVLKSTPTTERR